MSLKNDYLRYLTENHDSWVVPEDDLVVIFNVNRLTDFYSSVHLIHETRYSIQ